MKSIKPEIISTERNVTNSSRRSADILPGRLPKNPTPFQIFLNIFQKCPTGAACALLPQCRGNTPQALRSHYSRKRQNIETVSASSPHIHIPACYVPPLCCALLRRLDMPAISAAGRRYCCQCHIHPPISHPYIAMRIFLPHPFDHPRDTLSV